ncbi:MAG: homoserine dehydrogenase [Thermodesulfobacteriota bacterium]
MKKINIGIIGFGTVGSGTAQVLHDQLERMARRSGIELVLKTVVEQFPRDLPEPFADVPLITSMAELCSDPAIDIVVELIGGLEPARTFVLQAIEAGKHVVTANKALLSEHGMEIFAAANKAGVEVGFEASVGGGIPVIKAMKEGLVANRIDSIRGILNGTANYILSKMTSDGAPFAEVLKEAQEKGFAEADPTYDVEGIDTAHKLVILMTMAYGMPVRLSDVSIEGISAIEPTDINFAKAFGHRIKLLAISRNHGDHVEARVHPTLVPEDHLLAAINGPMNSVHIHGDMVGDILLYGAGAGKMPTGSAVVADIMDIARNIDRDSVNRVPALSYLPEEMRPRVITPMEQLRCPYYFRFSTVDAPGVLATIAGILGKHDISIESVIQKGREAGKTVPIVMHTHEAQEAAVEKALAEINSLDIITADTVKIRVLTGGE